jgi:hypothetical protein
MLEEFAIWLGCNPMHGELSLCAVNTVLIAPGVVGMFSIFLLYFLALFFALFAVMRGVIRTLRRWTG